VTLFWGVAILLALAALLVLLYPLLRAKSQVDDDRQALVTVFRQELAEATLDEAGLSGEEAAARRTEITRRLLSSAERKSRRLEPGSRTERAWRLGAAAAIAGLLPAAAFALYFAYGAPAATDAGTVLAERSAQRLDGPVAQLQKKLARDPNHPKGWILLARSLMTLGRFGEAEKAYQQAIRLNPGGSELHGELGEVLVLGAGGTITPAAKREFARDPQNPRSRYYLAEATLQEGDTKKAVAALKALLAEAPAGAPWRGLVAKRLRQVEAAAPTR
jgi:cytochrome c-type biogenesis protein CcmH